MLLKWLLLGVLAFSLAVAACKLGSHWLALLASKPTLALMLVIVPLVVLMWAINKERLGSR